MFFEKIGKQAFNLFVILLPWSVLMSVFGGEKLDFEVIRFWKEILLFFIFVLYSIDAYRKKEKISADSIDVAILLYVFWLLLISAFNHASLSSYVYGLRYDAEFLLAFMFLRRVIPFW